MKNRDLDEWHYVQYDDMKTFPPYGERVLMELKVHIEIKGCRPMEGFMCYAKRVSKNRMDILAFADQGRVHIYPMTKVIRWKLAPINDQYAKYR